MDIFQFREELVGDYASYVKSFIQIQDPRINQVVTKELDGGALWPEPLIQLNPSFESGGFIQHSCCSQRTQRAAEPKRYLFSFYQ